jgi:hypothetical protein
VSRISDALERWLLEPIQPHRVRILDGQSYLPQQDVRAHLIRLFGFCGHSIEVVETALAFEQPIPPYMKNGKEITGRWDVCYRATVRLTVYDPETGEELAHWEDSATGDAQNQTRLAGHDLALKSAVSTAIKRAATNLGDQFGLSLYNKEQEAKRAPFVRRILSRMFPDDSTADIPAASEEERPTDPDTAEPAASAGRTPPPRAASQPTGTVPIGHQFANWVGESVPQWTLQQRQQKAMQGLVAMGVTVTDLRQVTDEQWKALWDKWLREGLPLDPEPETVPVVHQLPVPDPPPDNYPEMGSE